MLALYPAEAFVLQWRRLTGRVAWSSWKEFPLVSLITLARAPSSPCWKFQLPSTSLDALYVCLHKWLGIAMQDLSSRQCDTNLLTVRYSGHLKLCICNVIHLSLHLVKNQGWVQCNKTASKSNSIVQVERYIKNVFPRLVNSQALPSSFSSRMNDTVIEVDSSKGRAKHPHNFLRLTKSSGCENWRIPISEHHRIAYQLWHPNIIPFGVSPGIITSYSLAKISLQKSHLTNQDLFALDVRALQSSGLKI